MVNPVEAFFDVRFQNVLGFQADVVEDGFEGVLGTASRSEPVTVGFKAGFPFWFERQLDQGLFCPVAHDGDAKWSSFVWITGFWDVDPTDWGGRRAERAQLSHHPHPLNWRETGNSIHAGCLFPPIVLRYLPYCQASR